MGFGVGGGEGWRQAGELASSVERCATAAPDGGNIRGLGMNPGHLLLTDFKL